ncbi:TerD family protein [Prescottella defluvii]|uniref:TerD family protein n=1 Tax=Prescottella defluvii TaxID=1323361 RepID=UPI0018CD0B65|nr:TerD family protein [Prescottella defluvii]
MPGQNAVLSTTTVRFTADSPIAFDVSALVADSSHRALSSDDFVFYNQPQTRGVRLGPDGIEIDLDAVHPDADAVLCIASVDPAAAPGAAFTDLTATLHDRNGAPVGVVEIGCSSAESAVICWELYRRAGQWKMRAVGQGYSDGLAGLITRHGVSVNDTADAAETAGAPTPTPAPTAPPVPEPEPAAGYAPIEPLDPDQIVERFGMIHEDAARSAGACIAARQFAESRLDSELTAAVSDPATRNGPAAAQARALAQQRHDTVVEEAYVRYCQDSAHLQRELDAITPMLPRPFAAWDAPAWVSGGVGGSGDGIRIGELSAPQCGPLSVPVCLPFPLRRPLRIIGPDTPATSAVAAAVTLRVLSTDADIRLDVVDLSGGLRSLTSALAHRPGGSTISGVADVSTYLEAAAASVELGILERADGVRDAEPSRRLIVLNHFPFGYEQRHWPAIEFLAEHGPSIGVSMVIVGEDFSAIGTDDDPVRSSYALPAADRSEWCDPWTFNDWTFTPDRIPADSDRLAQVLAHFADR